MTRTTFRSAPARWRAGAIVLTAALGIGGALGLAGPASAFPILTGPIFSSTDLRDCVAGTLGQPTSDPITYAQMESLTNLSCNNKTIQEFSALSSAKNLVSLTLQSDEISSFAALKDLHSLETLDLRNNYISEFPTMTGLTSLDSIYLDDNSITSLSHLSGLKSSLSALSLSDNYISTISAIRTFDFIDSLWLDGNSIRDLSGLAHVIDGGDLFDATDQVINYSGTTVNTKRSLPAVYKPSSTKTTLKVGSGSVAHGKITDKKYITWTTTGVGQLSWSVSIPMNGSTGQYSGTIERDVLKKMTSSTPKITGTAKVGKTLNASAKGWTSGVTKYYDWQRDGKSVKYGESSSYKLTSKDKGHRIRVSVTGFKQHYLDVTRTSAKTATVSN